MVHPWMDGLIVVQEVGAEEDEDDGDDHGDEVEELMVVMMQFSMLSDGTKVSIGLQRPLHVN